MSIHKLIFMTEPKRITDHALSKSECAPTEFPHTCLKALCGHAKN